LTSNRRIEAQGGEQNQQTVADRHAERGYMHRANGLSMPRRRPST
jgi:hypothetical protein